MTFYSTYGNHAHLKPILTEWYLKNILYHPIRGRAAICICIYIYMTNMVLVIVTFLGSNSPLYVIPTTSLIYLANFIDFIQEF